MRFIRGHGLVHVLSLVNASSDGLHIYLALISAALLGVGLRGGFSSHMFTPALWRGWHLPICFFCFTRYSAPLIFYCSGFSAVSYLGISLRAPLHSWGSFSLSMYPTFLEGFQRGKRFFSILPTRAGLSVPSDLLRYLRSCRRVFNRLTAHLAALLSSSWSSQIYLFSCGFSKVLGRTAPRLRATSRELCYLPSIFLV